MAKLVLSPKYKQFLRHQNAEAEFLEGETVAGKTTVGAIKFMFKVAQSSDRLHFIAGDTTGDVEKNIINADLGLRDVFGDRITYHGNGDANNNIPHLKYKLDNGDIKLIYILGYADKSKWRKALGSQFGCGLIDEINTANIDFVREATMRCKYWMATLNPDDPNLPIYEEYINRARPLPEFINDTPPEIQELLTEPEHPKWTYWFFKMDHNAGISEERKQQIRNSVPKGTKIYKNKILGLRGRSTGLVMTAFDRQVHLISPKQAKALQFIKFTTGVDTSYSRRSDDTIAFIFQGLTRDGKLVKLDEEVFNNKHLSETNQELSPSDVAMKLYEFLERNRKAWGFGKDVYIDNADQGTLLELRKHKKKFGWIYEFYPADKRLKIIDRIQLENGWYHDEQVYILDTLEEHIHELELYSWSDKGDIPEDRNDHTINASQYGWMPLKHQIGVQNQNGQGNYEALIAGLR